MSALATEAKLTNGKCWGWWMVEKQRGIEFNIRPPTWVTGTNRIRIPRGNYIAILQMLRRRYVSFIDLTQESLDHRAN